MALPLGYLRPLLEPHGFTVAFLIQAAEAADVPGLGELAHDVATGLVPPTTPEVVAVHEPTGGYPAIAVAVPITNEDAALLLAGDLVTARDVVEALEDAVTGFLEQARAGKFN
jgi:hypothetical protein